MGRLLISYYWYPWNNAGTFRWLGFAPYLDFDVFTSIKPVNSFKDQSIPIPDKKVYRYGKPFLTIYEFNAKLWAFIFPFFVLFKRYKTIIITSPPEPLIIWAYIFQLLGKRVLLDYRDTIERDSLRGKFLIPIYKFCYNRIKHVIVCWQFADPTKKVVYHGHDNLIRNKMALKEPTYDSAKRCFANYNYGLTMGHLPDFSKKPKNYACSSVHNIKHLGYPINNTEMHPEVYNCKPQDWKTGAMMIENLLYNIEK